MQDPTRIISSALSPSWSFLLSPTALWWAFLGLLIIFLIASGVFSYHWTTYGYHGRLLFRMGVLYAIGGIFLFGILAIAISAYAAHI